MKIFVVGVLLGVGAHATDSCFGTEPQYDKACSAITIETSCDVQAACRWGDPARNRCFAKDASDAGMQKICKTMTTLTDCNIQIACVWRSEEDSVKWVASVSSAVQALNVAAGAVPSTVSLSGPLMSSSHDHQTMDVATLQPTLNAWKV